jgi:hypothetical protein
MLRKERLIRAKVKMLTKTGIATCILIIALFSSTFSNSVLAVNLNVNWGHQKTNPDYDEQQYEQAACIDVNQKFNKPGWYTYYAYGQSSTSSNLQTTIGWRQNNDAWATDFWVGDFFGQSIAGGYWVITYEWQFNWETWQWEQVEIATFCSDGSSIIHYRYYGDQGNNVQDGDLESWTEWPYSKQHFTFSWTCACANIFPHPDNPSAQTYGWYDYTHSTGAVGMPFAWTARSDLNQDGFNNPDSSNYCYVGFNDTSVPLKEQTSNPGYRYTSYVSFFYEYLIGTGPRHTIKQSLNYASQLIWYCNWDNQYCPLSQGYQIWVEGVLQHGKMNVIGNSNMQMP